MPPGCENGPPVGGPLSGEERSCSAGEICDRQPDRPGPSPGRGGEAWRADGGAALEAVSALGDAGDALGQLRGGLRAGRDAGLDEVLDARADEAGLGARVAADAAQVALEALAARAGLPIDAVARGAPTALELAQVGLDAAPPIAQLALDLVEGRVPGREAADRRDDA